MTAVSTPKRLAGRYELLRELARGGTATVHLARLVGPIGFARTVAIKILHPAYASDQALMRMFIDEARLTSRLRHPNVVSVVDVLVEDGQLYLVMDYVAGVSLARALTLAKARGEQVSIDVAVGVMIAVLSGLHAAHEASGEHGEPLEIVHRDVSPQNVMVGIDGVARVVDFGIAKAVSRMQETADGQIKGKLAYMAPEQLAGRDVDRRTDLFAASTVFWEMLTGASLFGRVEAAATVAALTHGVIEDVRVLRPDVPPAIALLLERGLMREPDLRPDTALAMVRELEKAHPAASARAIGEWIASLGGEEEAETATAGEPPSLVTGLPGAATPRVSEPVVVTRPMALRPGSPSRTPEPRRRRAAIAAVAIAAAATTAAAAFAVTRARSGDRPGRAVAEVPSASAAPHAEEAPPPSASSAAPLASVPGTSSAPAGASRPKAAPAKRPRLDPSDCTVVNPDGTFVYRRECLR